MDLSSQPVTAQVELAFVAPDSSTLPVLADISYTPDDPYAVRVRFHTGVDDTVEWTFARSLLTDGVARPAGEGDVRVWPSHGHGGPIVCLSLCSPSGRALFEAPLQRLIEFLTETYATVPTGAEGDHVDVDTELAMMLGSDETS
jgi:hypothetical protein